MNDVATLDENVLDFEWICGIEQFEFKTKRQEKAICSKAIIDKSVAGDCQGYMMNFDCRTIRYAFISFCRFSVINHLIYFYLYGSFNKDQSVKVGELPQDNSD